MSETQEPNNADERCKAEERSEAEQLRQKLYSETRKDLLTRQLSNSENFDKAILSLSSAGLGLSLTFIKDIRASHLFLLQWSWYAFGLAIVITLISFLSSQRAITKQLDFAAKYYLEYQDEFLTKRNIPAKITIYLSYLSGFVFVGAIVLTIVFVSLNAKGGTRMSQQEKSRGELQGGQVIPAMQKVEVGGTEKHGAPIPSMQPVPQGTSPQSAPQPQAPTPQPGGGNQSTGGDQGASGSGSGSKK
jgi:hypothetical protein